jgi:hypothetical protein
MAWCRAGGRVAQAFAQRRQLADGGFELIRLLCQQRSIDPDTTTCREHAGNLVE